METYEVRFLQEALDDLEEIVLYIAQDNHSAALRMHEKIIEKANDLTIFPKRERLVPNKKMSAVGYRMLVVKPYIIFYRVIESNIFIQKDLRKNTPASKRTPSGSGV